jgi:hypothetical protein
VTKVGKRTDLNDPDIMASQEAAWRWGKTKDYVRQIVVTREVMEAVTGHEEVRE